MQTNALNELIGTLGLFQTKLFQYQFHLSDEYLTIKDDILARTYSINRLMSEVGGILLKRGETPISTCGEFIEYAWIKEHPYYVSLTDEQLIDDLILDLKSILDALNDNQKYFTEDELILAIFTRIRNVISEEIGILRKK